MGTYIYLNLGVFETRDAKGSFCARKFVFRLAFDLPDCNPRFICLGLFHPWYNARPIAAWQTDEFGDSRVASYPYSKASCYRAVKRL